MTAPPIQNRDVVDVETAEASIAAIIEQEGRPNLRKPRAYHVPLSRPSFFRIVKLFIEMEQELHRREQADHNDDSSDSDDSDPGPIINKKVKRPLPSLRCSEGTTEGPPDHIPEPPNIRSSALRREILRSSLEDIERLSAPDTTLLPTDNVPAQSIFSRDTAPSILTGASTLKSLHPNDNLPAHSIYSRDFAPSALTGISSQPSKRHQHIRFSDGTHSGGGGTEGSVKNAPFMPEARHMDPISVEELEKWNRPFWERYKPWELIGAVLFLLIVFGFVAAIIGVWAKQHQHHPSHKHDPKYVPGRRPAWSGNQTGVTTARGGRWGKGVQSSWIDAPVTPAWENIVPVVTLKGEGPLPEGVEEALAMATGHPA